METKTTRPPNDPLVNPQPGDVVRIRAGSRRTVTARDGDQVVMSSVSPGFPSPCEWRQPINNWLEQVRGAEVLNVAE